MTINVEASESDLFLNFVYWSDGLTDEHVANIASTFVKILTSIISQPEITLQNLDSFCDVSKKTIAKWNDKLPALSQDRIHDVIMRHALLTSKADAIAAFDGNFTYAEINKLSTKLAQSLIRLGVGPEILVPLYFEKSAWAIIAILGILKAGGAFVPLDPTHPAIRTRHLIANLKAKIIVSSRKYASQSVKLIENTVVVDQKSIDRLPSGAEHPSHVASNNTAYVLFTSGTTGTPKGTIIEHGAFCVSSAGFTKALSLDSTSRVLQFASYTFDASIMEIFGTLMKGGCLCIPEGDERLNNLAPIFNSFKINWAFLTPSVLTASNLEPKEVPQLKYLILGGETVPPSVVEIWSSCLVLIGAYGPTECSVVATVNGSIANGSSANIGHASAGYTWVVDKYNHNKLVSIGCIGELVLEGPTLARGYLDEDEKTAEAFIVNPPWAVSEGKERKRRMYKTGDLVRYNTDGSISFLGRKDSQIKLHGQRLEVAEIEHHVIADTKVKHALVFLPKIGSCAQRLVAIVTLRNLVNSGSVAQSQIFKLLDEEQKDDAALQLAAIQENLANKIPAYMVPTLWIVVEAMPLSSSGKLDRKQALGWVERMTSEAYAEITRSESDNELDVPATTIERKIQQIWANVLNLSTRQVGFSRSFLSLGGDSISAMQVISLARIEKIRLTIQEILHGKTISQLALNTQPFEQAVQREEAVGTSFSLSPIQNFYIQSVGVEHGHFNQSFLLRITKATSPQYLNRAIQALIVQHSMLRARFNKDLEGKWTQKITRDIGSSYSINSHQIEGPEDMSPIIAHTQASLDVTKGPVFAVEIFNKNDNEDQIVFFVAHHLVVDLVSWRTILRDLEDLLKGGTLHADKPLSFQYWCALQEEQRVSNMPNQPKHTSTDLSFWQLDEQENTFGDVLVENITVDQKITDLILKGCHEALRTDPVDILLSAIIVAFARVFPEREVPTIYNEGHGRESWDEQINIFQTVGWFTTLFPIYVPTTTEVDLIHVVRQIKDLRRRATDNGRQYFASRFTPANNNSFTATDFPLEVTFNYLGQYQQLESLDAMFHQVENAPFEISDVSTSVPRFSLFDMAVAVSQGCLQISLAYNQNMKQQTRIRRWLAECAVTLHEITETLAASKPSSTISDYPLLSLGYDELEKMTSKLLPTLGLSGVEEIEEICPSSPMQQSLLFSQGIDARYYTLQFTYTVRSYNANKSISPELLAKAWQKVVNRHESLRTVFVESLSHAGLFDQVILKYSKARIVVIQCDDDEALTTLEDQQRINYKDFRPLHRATICHTQNGTVFFKLEATHALIDGTSMQLLLRDLAKAYLDDMPKTSAPKYTDYISYIQKQTSNQAITYWGDYLSGIRPCLFPFINTRFNGQRELSQVHVLSFEKSAELHSFCKRNNFTVSNIIQTAWGLVLRSFTGSNDICFGYLCSGRDAPVTGIEDAIGLFINMLVCRIAFPDDQSISDVLQQVQSDFIHGLKYQHCSLAEVQHELHTGGKALFNTALSIQKVMSWQGTEQVILFDPIEGYDPTEVLYTFVIHEAELILMCTLLVYDRHQCRYYRKEYQLRTELLDR